jgi:putative transposase
VLFAADGINSRWYGDGTEIVVGEGKLYLDSVLDMGSRRIVGFAPGAHHDAALAYEALAMAVAVRGGAVPGVVPHRSGRRVHRGQFPGRVRAARHRPVGGRPGSALDNAVIESWHSTLEFEPRSLHKFATRAAAREDNARYNGGGLG